MQMMADIRMLQEQTQQMQQQLQAALDAINAQLKAISTRVDDQASASRKSFADQKLAVDQFGSDLRVVRERIDESNVRITTLSQEVEALRLAIPDMSATAGAPGSAGRPQCAASDRRSGALSPCAAADHVAGDLAAAAVQHCPVGFHRRPMDALHRRVQHLPQGLFPVPMRPTMRSGTSVSATTRTASSRRRLTRTIA